MKENAIVKFQAGSLERISRIKKCGKNARYYIKTKRDEGAWITATIGSDIFTSVQFSREADAGISCVISEHSLDAMCKLDKQMPKGADVCMEISEDKIVEHGGGDKCEEPCEICDYAGINMLGSEEKIRFTVRGDDFMRIITNAVKMYKDAVRGVGYVQFIFLGDGKMNILAGCSTWIMRYTCESDVDRQCFIRVEGDAFSWLSAFDFKGCELNMTLIERGGRNVLKIERDGVTIYVSCTTRDKNRCTVLYTFLSINGSDIACIKAEDLKRACKTGSTYVRIYLDGEDLMIGNYDLKSYGAIQEVKAVKANGKAACCEVDVWLYQAEFVKALRAYKSGSVLRIGQACYSREFNIGVVSFASDDRFVIFLPDCSTLENIKRCCQSDEKEARL